MLFCCLSVQFLSVCLLLSLSMDLVSEINAFIHSFIHNFVKSRAINAAAQILLVDAFVNDTIVCFSRFRGGSLDIINLMQSMKANTINKTVKALFYDVNASSSGT